MGSEVTLRSMGSEILRQGHLAFLNTERDILITTTKTSEHETSGLYSLQQDEHV